MADKAVDKAIVPGTVPIDSTADSMPLDSSRDMEEDAAILRERWLRTAAELENLRKRTDRRIEIECRRDRDALLRDFLKVVDSIERALASNNGEQSNPWAQGMRAIAGQMTDLLQQNGVEPFEAMGKSFDPEIHDAVAAVESANVPEGIVVEVVERGYRTKRGILLRPAKVIVARRAES